MKQRTFRRVTMRHRWRRYTLEWHEKPEGGDWRLVVHRLVSMGIPRCTIGSPDFRGVIDCVLLKRTKQQEKPHG